MLGVTGDPLSPGRRLAQSIAVLTLLCLVTLLLLLAHPFRRNALHACASVIAARKLTSLSWFGHGTYAHSPALYHPAVDLRFVPSIPLISLSPTDLLAASPDAASYWRPRGASPREREALR